MSGRGRALTAGLAAVAVAGGVTVAVLARDGDASASPDDGLPSATTEITRGTLTDAVTQGGTLGYGTERLITTQLSGTVTWLPEEGAVVRRGESLLDVDARPVVLLYGDIPAWRDLGQGDEGRDVRQLERNLWELGYRGFEVDREFTYYTAIALEEWQEDLGIDETGVLAMSDVVVHDGPARVSAVAADLGDVLAPGTSPLTVTGTIPAATVDLDPADRRLVRAGTEVKVGLPDGSSAAASIVDVSTEVSQSDSAAAESEGTTTVIVVAELEGREARRRAREYDAASVDVTFTAGARRNVLIVPVAALVALSEGGFGLEVVEDGSSRYVAVDAGLFSGGRVEVSGPDIAEGTVVGVPG